MRSTEVGITEVIRVAIMPNSGEGNPKQIPLNFPNCYSGEEALQDKFLLTVNETGDRYVIFTRPRIDILSINYGDLSKEDLMHISDYCYNIACAKLLEICHKTVEVAEIELRVYAPESIRKWMTSGGSWCNDRYGNPMPLLSLWRSMSDIMAEKLGIRVNLRIMVSELTAEDCHQYFFMECDRYGTPECCRYGR